MFGITDVLNSMTRLAMGVDAYAELAVPKTVDKENDTKIISKEPKEVTKELIGEILEVDKNYVFSPIALYYSLILLAAISKNKSQQQLLKLLGLKENELKEKAKTIVGQYLLYKREETKCKLGALLCINEKFKTKQQEVDKFINAFDANAVFGEMGNPCMDEQIHEWLNEKTENLLKNSVDEIKTETNTLMMLFATIYFKGAWMKAFSHDCTKKDTFHVSHFEEIKCDFMNETVSAKYLKGENFKAAKLPLKDGFEMVFVLPDKKNTVKSVLQDNNSIDILTGTKSLYGEDDCFGFEINQMKNNKWYNLDLKISLPKFDIAYDNSIADKIKRLGVDNIFDMDNAEFSLFDLKDGDKPYVSDIKMAARLKLDENGVEAAAYVMNEFKMVTTCIKRSFEFKLDRPFIFSLVHNDLPIFTGTVVNPSRHK